MSKSVGVGFSEYLGECCRHDLRRAELPSCFLGAILLVLGVKADACMYEGFMVLPFVVVVFCLFLFWKLWEGMELPNGLDDG